MPAKRKSTRGPAKKRKPNAYALFVKKAYAGQVTGLKLKSCGKSVSAETRKKNFKANAKAISQAYKRSKK